MFLYANAPYEGLSGGAIAGIVVGSVAFVSLGCFALRWFVIKKKSLLNLQESHVWEFIPNDAMRVKGFVFLVRQRATKDAVQSQAMAFWYNYSRERVGEYRKITAEQAYEMMNTQEVVIVDVRTQSEYDEGHIQNAVLIPNETIGSDSPTNLPDKNAIILVYCRSGRRSEEAARKLVNLGYVSVYDFGGINDWTYGTVTD